MGIHLLKRRFGNWQKFAWLASCLVPAVENLVHRLTTPGRAGFGIERIEGLQPQDRIGIEGIRIAAQPVEPGGRYIDLALLGSGQGARAGIARGRLGVVDLPGKLHGHLFFKLARIIAQHRLDPQDETRRNHRRAHIAPGPAQYHLRCAQRGGEIMRGKADAEVRPRHPQCPQNCRRQQRIGRWASRPDAFDQPAADDQIGARHPRFEQAVDRYAGMTAPGRAHGHAVHRIAQHGMQFARIEHGSRRPRRLAKFLDECRERTPGGTFPQCLAAQRLSGNRQPIQQGRQRRLPGKVEQWLKRRFGSSPPFTDPGLPGAFAQRGEPGSRSRSAQRQIKLAGALKPGCPAIALAHQRMGQQGHQRHWRQPVRP